MLIPRDAIVMKPDGSESIWKIIENNGQIIARSFSVTTGQAYRDYIEVFSRELQSGDKVVVRGNELLQSDQAVHVISEQKLNL